jgi:hypothetical protein
MFLLSLLVVQGESEEIILSFSIALWAGLKATEIDVEPLGLTL